MISLVANSEVEDVEIFAEKHRKEGLRAHDQKGNSLLHIAVMCNKILTFEWLLRKLGISALLQKNEEGLTPADLATRLDRREILSYIPHSMV
jgi:ankyrin repeat protein